MIVFWIVLVLGLVLTSWWSRRRRRAQAARLMASGDAKGLTSASPTMPEVGVGNFARAYLVGRNRDSTRPR